MKTLSDLRQMFRDQVEVSDIKYDWDSGHCYSYIDHPLVNQEFSNQEDQDDWDDFCSEWLYSNDECPPCQISVENNVVSSGCGCHDHLDYVIDREEIEGIIEELQEYKQ